PARLSYCCVCPGEVPSCPTRRSSDLPSEPEARADGAAPDLLAIGRDGVALLRPDRQGHLGHGVGHELQVRVGDGRFGQLVGGSRSEEHTSELQSRENLVWRLLLEKKI